MRSAVTQTRRALIVPNAISTNVTWSYTFQTPGPDWFRPGYNDRRMAGWRGWFRHSGHAGGAWSIPFGTPTTSGCGGSLHSGSRGRARDLKLEAHHDEDLEVYLNGVLAAKLSGFIEHYGQFDLRPEAVATLKPGD